MQWVPDELQKERCVSIKRLKANVRHQPGIAIIDLHGEIDASAENVLNSAYNEAESEEPGSILLNFSNVQYINSTGIALIVSLLGRARKSQRRLLACGLSDHYVEIFKITRLADFMSVFPDEASALKDATVTRS
jgi:anti-anti-sigma factor